jgi:hypothetical protein
VLHTNFTYATFFSNKSPSTGRPQHKRNVWY